MDNYGPSLLRTRGIGHSAAVITNRTLLAFGGVVLRKRSERLQNWLLHHPRYGVALREWQEHGALSRRARWIATAMLILLLIPPIIITSFTVVALGHHWRNRYGCHDVLTYAAITSPDA